MPIGQQMKPGYDVNLNNYEAFKIIITEDKFLVTLNPEYNGYQLFSGRGQKINKVDLMRSDFQSEFSIAG